MTDRKPTVATDIAEACDFRYSATDRYSPFDCSQLRHVVEELEGELPRAGKDKRELMLRVAEEAGFGDDTDRYRNTKNGPPPFTKEHLLRVREAVVE